MVRNWSAGVIFSYQEWPYSEYNGKPRNTRWMILRPRIHLYFAPFARFPFLVPSSLLLPSATVVSKRPVSLGGQKGNMETCKRKKMGDLGAVYRPVCASGAIGVPRIRRIPHGRRLRRNVMIRYKAERRWADITQQIRLPGPHSRAALLVLPLPLPPAQSPAFRRLRNDRYC